MRPWDKGCWVFRDVSSLRSQCIDVTIPVLSTHPSFVRIGVFIESNMLVLSDFGCYFIHRSLITERCPHRLLTFFHKYSKNTLGGIIKETIFQIASNCFTGFLWDSTRCTLGVALADALSTPSGKTRSQAYKIKTIVNERTEVRSCRLC